MRAAITDFEGPEGLTFQDVVAPVCGPDEVLVNVKATALNRADLLQTMGMYPAPKGVAPNIPGLEYAGVVAAVGARVTKWKSGDRVMGLVAGGAWAEQLVAHEREVLPIPANIDFAQAAAIPEAFSTAFDAMVLQAGLIAGSQVLIHAVASGVGTAALQLVKLFGATAIGTGRKADKLERTVKLGLPHPVLVKDGAFADAVIKASNGHGADLALDLVGGDWFAETIRSMAPRGTIMQVGLVGGSSAEIPLQLVLSRRLRIIGTALRSRAIEEKIVVAQAMISRVLPAFDRGDLSPVIDAVVPMADLKSALARLASNDSFGKLVLTW